jgi:hypothetical protein
LGCGLISAGGQQLSPGAGTAGRQRLVVLEPPNARAPDDERVDRDDADGQRAQTGGRAAAAISMRRVAVRPLPHVPLPRSMSWSVGDATR